MAAVASLIVSLIRVVLLLVKHDLFPQNESKVELRSFYVTFIVSEQVISDCHENYEDPFGCSRCYCLSLMAAVVVSLAIMATLFTYLASICSCDYW